jgi:glycosyltransferase involved in cell wall biosynthesis
MDLMENGDRRRKLGIQAREKLLARFTVEFTAPHILSTCRSVAHKQPVVSVIVPNYNHGRFLKERLSSIFNQTFRDFEVILLDDASSDNSREIFEQYRDHADVRIIRNTRNSGSTFKQWLKGIELAKADILWIAESDDRSEPDFLETLLAAFRDPRVKLAYANSHVIDESGAIIGDYTDTRYLASLSSTKWTTGYQISAEQEINDGLGIKNTILSASSAVFRKFALSPQARKKLASMRIAGDWYFFIHAIAGGELYYSSRKLNHHRRHGESVVGKMLEQNRVSRFFREFSEVQSVIFRRYPLFEGFHRKWEQHLKDQWQEFFPDRSFEDLKRYYPINRLRGQIMASLARRDSDEPRYPHAPPSSKAAHNA